MGYHEASQALLNLAEEVIEKHHPRLAGARVGFVFRDEVPAGGVPGKGMKAPGIVGPHLELDYIVWIDVDLWNRRSREAQRAMIDHALSHIFWKPDVVEFSTVIEHYGAWSDSLFKANQVINDQVRQLVMELKLSHPRAEVKTFDPSGMEGEA